MHFGHVGVEWLRTGLILTFDGLALAVHGNGLSRRRVAIRNDATRGATKEFPLGKCWESGNISSSDDATFTSLTESAVSHAGARDRCTILINHFWQYNHVAVCMAATNDGVGNVNKTPHKMPKKLGPREKTSPTILMKIK